jgi:hypothetical protein
VREPLDGIVDRGSPVMANCALVRTMLNVAVDHDWIDASPAARVKRPTKEIPRERVLQLQDPPGQQASSTEPPGSRQPAPPSRTTDDGRLRCAACALLADSAAAVSKCRTSFGREEGREGLLRLLRTGAHAESVRDGA